MTRAQWHCDLEQRPEIDRLSQYGFWVEGSDVWNVAKGADSGWDAFPAVGSTSIPEKATRDEQQRINETLTTRHESLHDALREALRRVWVDVPECGPDCGLAAEAER